PVEFTRTLQRMKVVATADRLAADEDLGHGASAAGAGDHRLPGRRIEGDVDFLVVDGLAVEQALRGRTVAAELRRIDGYRLHRSPVLTVRIRSVPCRRTPDPGPRPGC